MSASDRYGRPLRVEFGLASTHFLNGEKGRSVRHARPWVVVLAYRDATLEAILPLQEAIAPSARPAVFFCAEMPTELLNTLIVNNIQGALRCVVVTAPITADYDRAALFDIAAACGARIIASNRVLAATTLAMLGEADEVTVDAVSTVLSGFPLLRPA